jgi:tetratricopeptide (TPR) repeat protein
LYYGYALARRGELAEAQRLLGNACARLRGLNQAPRLLAQGLDELSEAHRLAGDRDGALRCLAEAEQLQRAHHYDADLAERTLAQRAKVWGRSGEAAAALGEAYLLQSRLRHRMGLARTHVLMARLCSSRNGHQRRRTLLHGLSAQLPSLGACACLRKILEHWPAWTASEMLDGETDAFWGT